MFEAAQSTLLTTFVLFSPWRPLWKQQCPEQSCLGQRSSCQKCSCTVCRGERHCKGLGVPGQWYSGFQSAWYHLPGFSLGLQYCLPWWKWWCGKWLLFSCCDSLRSLSESGYVWTYAPRFVGMRFSSLLPCRKHVCALLTDSFLAPTYLQFPNLRFEFQCLYWGCSQHLAWFCIFEEVMWHLNLQLKLDPYFQIVFLLPVVKHVLAFQHFKSLYPKKNALYALWEGS